MDATVAVLPGDGIGPEVIAEGVRVLEAVGRRWGHRFVIREARIGGHAIDLDGVPLPGETLAACREASAVLLGAVGGPQWDDPSRVVRPEQGLLQLRRGLGLFANLRPVRVLPAMAEASPLRPGRLEGVDLLFVRELTGGIYFGRKGREPAPPGGGGERAFDECAYTTEEIERVVRVAAGLASGRSGRLTSVDKANVLETSRLWRRVTERVVRDDFPGLELEHVLVDACAMHLLLRPGSFDVIVTENMFGDILTDEASVLAGSLGVLPSASLGAGPPERERTSGSPRAARPGLYEPIHGSAPDIAGQDIANPVGTILSVAMLLRHSLGLDSEARAVEGAVERVLAEGGRTKDLAGGAPRWLGTQAMGRAVIEALDAAERPARPEPSEAAETRT